MTCEVAIMNKYAVVIAADSAVTSTDGNGASRYSKGGNKIFQLSRHQPVGVMIYGAATLDGVPWEIIIKAYRDVLGDSKLPNLCDYAVAFFNFVKSAKHFFPESDLDLNYRRCLNAAATKLLDEAKDASPIIFDTQEANDVRKAAWDDFLEKKLSELLKLSLHSEIPPQAWVASEENISEHYPSDMSEFLAKRGLDDVVEPGSWFKCACTYFFACHTEFLGSTGIVFSGFGTEQYFPQVIEYDVPGFVNREFIYTQQDFHSCQIGHDVPSAIFQFAMTSSIDAFTQGVDVAAYSQARRSYIRGAKELALSVLASTNQPAPDDLDDLVEASAENFSTEWISSVAELHYHPMKRVIATLPIEEMTHLAETLVVLQSLKERVTSPSQSVGGPIDVAVITKSEGLVWIKRKHFFDAEKNLRYVLRQKALSI